jgi:phosphatidylinositol glycan class N
MITPIITSSNLLIIGIIVHLIFFISIFDVYFRSPVDTSLLLIHNNNSKLLLNPQQPLSNRVVLIVADGLRADVCFSFMGRDVRYHTNNNHDEVDDTHYQASSMMWPRSKESFLRYVIENLGAWGVAHTRVPTETRPGHVALIAGMYEDVSAVTHGWQANPVPFDHVFRNARHTYAWGHEDVTGLFARDEISKSKITQQFPPHQEDFGDKNLSSMDVWVFNRVNEFLLRSPDSPSRLDSNHPNSTQLVFFLHLGALDANGHAFRPFSHEYFDNTALVDRGVAGIYHLFESAFNHDGKTTYIFSSDHGMSVRGAHGDGHPDNTRTPFIAWGAGITGPEKIIKTEFSTNNNDNNNHHHHHSLIHLDGTYSLIEEMEFIKQWRLEHLVRRDLEQGDVAPLIATLLGIPIPAHSVGLLPLAYLYPGPTRAWAILRNVEQLLIQVQSKENRRKKNTLSFRFYPSVHLEKASQLHVQAMELLNSPSDTTENLTQVEKLCQEIATLCRIAMRYHQIYDRPLLMGSVTLGYLGYMFLISESIFGEYQKTSTTTAADAAATASESSNHKISSTVKIISALYEWIISICVLVLASTCIVLLMEHASFQHILYPIVSLLLWLVLWFNNKSADVTMRTELIQHTLYNKLPLLIFVWIETQILVIGYSSRPYLSVLMILQAIQPFIFFRNNKPVTSQKDGKNNISWSLSCVLLAMFTSMDIDSSPNIYTMIGSGILAMIVLGYNSQLSTTKLIFTSTVLLSLALVVSTVTDISIAQSTHGEKLHWYWRMFAWIIFFLAPFWYKISNQLFYGGGTISMSITENHHVLTIAFSVLVTQYTLLAVNYEVCFLTCLYLLLMLWQRRLLQGSTATPDLFSMASTFLVISNVAFFATGNFASMSSFHLSSTFRFSSVYNPFLMAVLLIYKVMIPYLLVTIAVVDVLVTHQDKNNTSYRSHLFLIVIGLCDCLAITLFFLVRDEGSWLEIGNTISQYGFACAHLIFVPVIFLISLNWVKWIM